MLSLEIIDMDSGTPLMNGDTSFIPRIGEKIYLESSKLYRIVDIVYPMPVGLVSRQIVGVYVERIS